MSCVHEQRVHSVKLPYCVSSFYIQTSTRKTNFLGAAYSIVASCLCFGEGILLQTVVKVPACLPVFALLLVSCLQLRCWKISRTVWIYQDWTLLICICTYSWLMLKTISDGAFATLNWEGWTCSIDTKKMHQIFPSFIRLPTSLFCLFVYMNLSCVNWVIVLFFMFKMFWRF